MPSTSSTKPCIVVKTEVTDDSVSDRIKVAWHNQNISARCVGRTTLTAALTSKTPFHKCDEYQNEICQRRLATKSIELNAFKNHICVFMIKGKFICNVKRAQRSLKIRPVLEFTRKSMKNRGQPKRFQCHTCEGRQSLPQTAPVPLADLRGVQGTPPPPPGGRIFFNFMQFSGNFNKIISWRPPGSWRPLLGEILDPPLSTDIPELQSSILRSF